MTWKGLEIPQVTEGGTHQPFVYTVTTGTGFDSWFKEEAGREIFSELCGLKRTREALN